jgi:hypothetical protein
LKEDKQFSGPQLARSELVFSEENVLGSGSYGVVYKGMARNTPVAIKKNLIPIDKKAMKEIQAEINAMRCAPLFLSSFLSPILSLDLCAIAVTL